jgi:hypothetical protein
LRLFAAVRAEAQTYQSCPDTKPDASEFFSKL